MVNRTSLATEQEVNKTILNEKAIQNALRPYVKLLGSKSDYVNWRDQSHYPNQSEVTAHLLLLKCFRVLKQKVLVGISHEKLASKLWQCYLTVAVRRFLMFYSAINEKYPSEADKNECFLCLDTLLPPLDVLMVWHTFCLSTTSIFSNSVTLQRFNGVKYPFPLYQFQKAVTRDFIFRPKNELQENFELFINEYLIKNKLSNRFYYDCYQPFDVSDIELPIYCSFCSVQLATVPLMNDLGTGFSDSGFNTMVSKKCLCPFGVTLTHDELRKRQLFTDCSREHDIPSIHTYFSPVLMKTPGAHLVELVNKKITRHLQYNLQEFSSMSLRSYIEMFSRDYSKSHELIPPLRDYLSYYLVHSTLPSPCQINDDLVAGMLRQERFIDKMEQLNLLTSSALLPVINDAIDRYGMFLHMLEFAKFPVVPTLDIDLVWHTHQLSFYSYYAYCLKRFSHLVVHNDKMEENRMSFGFETTAKKFKSWYKQDYSLCLCQFCTYHRNVNKKSLIFGKKEKQQSAIGDASRCHISSHNAIKVPTPKQDKINRQYKNFRKQNWGEKLPWDYQTDIETHVTPVVSPITEKAHIAFYEQGVCANIVDAQSACEAQSAYYHIPAPPRSSNNMSYCGGSSG